MLIPSDIFCANQIQINSYKLNSAFWDIIVHYDNRLMVIGDPLVWSVEPGD